jgi:hypothetical protein
MRSIEGKMRGGIKPDCARCTICKEQVSPGLRIRAVIEKTPSEDQPGIFFAHPECLKHYLARHDDLKDSRDGASIPDAAVRKFWVDIDAKKGWGGFINKVLPIC